MTVRRVPLLKMPQTAFMLTANNVVLGTRGTVRRAEGFASLLPPLDAAAREAFAARAYRPHLFPPPARRAGGGVRGERLPPRSLTAARPQRRPWRRLPVRVESPAESSRGRG